MTETPETCLNPAAQAEIDAAASEQMRQDAAVGRALRTMPDVKIMFSLTNFEGQVDFICTVQTQGAPSYRVYIKPTPYDCLVAAGLVEEGNRG